MKKLIQVGLNLIKSDKQNGVKNSSKINYFMYSRLNQSDHHEKGSSSDSSSEELFPQRRSMVTKGEYNMRQNFESSYEELVDSKRKMQRLKIIIYVLIVLFFAALVAVAVILIVTNSNKLSVAKVKGLELDSIISGQLVPKRFNGSWLMDDSIVYKGNKGVLEFNITTGKSRPITSSRDERIATASLFEKSSDEKYFLIAQGITKVFRHSFIALYYIMKIDTQEIFPLTINGEQVPLLLVKWSPVGNSLIINYEGNLYYKPDPSTKEIQLTFDSSRGITNGCPDWVYEEEVFSSNVAVWFSPNGTKIAYIQFNDSSTRIINIPYYGVPGDIKFQYPSTRPVFYPKAGSANPFVTLYQIDLRAVMKGSDEKLMISVPVQLNTEEHIISVVDWITDDSLLSIWMNRIQNRAYIQISDTSRRYEIFSMESKTGWVDLFTTPIRNGDGTKIALSLPHRQGDSGDYKHLSILSTKNNANTKPIPLTSGKYVVQNILHWDPVHNVIFYLANQPNKSRIMHLYAIKADKGQKPQCITCGTMIGEIEQTLFAAEFSPSGKYIVVTSLGPSPPNVNLYKWSYDLDKVVLSLVLEWENNQEVVQLLSQKDLPEMEYHSIDLGGGLTADVQLQLPPKMDRSGSTKYPMLVDVYGGPDSKAVMERFTVDWGSYLASNRSIIYAKIDGRGASLRGDRHLHSLYLKLGTYEVFDQINVTRVLQNTLPYIDEKRSGIWGWSYGGYASAMALASDDRGVFKCATSVAPVTDWTYYDSIYTERYMSLPKLNAIGYQKSRLTTRADHFKGKRYMLVHGTLDDNVHFQQSMMLAKGLELNDIMFTQISYADEDHGLAGVRRHLYHSLDNFFGECFDLPSDKTFGK